MPIQITSSNLGAHSHLLAAGATDVTATPTEVNKLAGVTAGTAAASKAAVLGTSKNLDILGLPVSGLKIGVAGAEVVVSATAANLNAVSGVTPGTTSASKALVVDANSSLDTLGIAAGGLKIGPTGGTAVTATAAELNTTAGVTAGTAAASKAVVLDANKQIGGLKRKVTAASGDGAIAIADGIVKITKGSEATLTLADPAAGDEGTELLITAQTAFAHTVSNAAGSGFNGGGAGSDVATFGGAIGDCFRIVAINALWNVAFLTNVTLS